MRLNMNDTVELGDCQRTLSLSICSCQLLKYIWYSFAVEAIPLLASRTSCCLNNLTLECVSVVVVDEV